MYGGGCDGVDSVGADASACCNRIVLAVMLHNGSVGDRLDGGAILDDDGGCGEYCSRYCWNFRVEQFHTE